MWKAEPTTYTGNRSGYRPSASLSVAAFLTANSICHNTTPGSVWVYEGRDAQSTGKPKNAFHSNGVQFIREYSNVLLKREPAIRKTQCNRKLHSLCYALVSTTEKTSNLQTISCYGDETVAPYICHRNSAYSPVLCTPHVFLFNRSEILLIFTTDIVGVGVACTIMGFWHKQWLRRRADVSMKFWHKQWPLRRADVISSTNPQEFRKRLANLSPLISLGKF